LLLKNLSKLFLFIPLILYFGKRSLIAYDEGFYALQAKWILENNNWIAPLWWGNISLDRTIGIQNLIAISQKVFGNNIFVIYIPNILAAGIMLFGTYYLHKELIKNKYSIISPIILATSFLWINYAHMATQDIIFSSLVTIGILVTIKSIKTEKTLFYFLSGIWIGLAFIMKTFLTVIPFISLLPVLYKFKIIKNKYFFLGLIIGFIPFIIWSFLIVFNYGSENYLGLFDKLLFLSKNNNFTNPFYYYLWNLPLSLFPWSVFSIIGFFKARKLDGNLSKYFLFTYPLITLFLISLFSTKIPYYTLQIFSLLSINSYIGIDNLIRLKIKSWKIINHLLFKLVPLLLISAVIYINLFNTNLNIEYNQKVFLSIGIFSLGIFWLFSNILKSHIKKLSFILIGPYLLTLLVVQSGLISDRAKDIRIASANLIKNQNLMNEKIQVVKNDLKDETSIKKIIKILVFMPRIGNGISSIEDIKKNNYAWTTAPEIKIRKEYTVVDNSDAFKPWKIIRRN